MALDKDYVIFDKKTFGELAKDIYNNVKIKKSQINKVLAILAEKMDSQSGLDDRISLVRDLMETAVKNDEQLVKLAAIVQRGISSSEDGSGDMILTNEEREQLMAEHGQLRAENEKEIEVGKHIVSPQVALREDSQTEKTEPNASVDDILAKYSETDELIQDFMITDGFDEDGGDEE